MRTRITDNFSYKFVALGVALILWMSMLGRRDSTLVREFELQVLHAQGIDLESQSHKFVRVEVAGPRVALKKINNMDPVFVVDLSSAKPGRQVVKLSPEGLNLPIGSRVIHLEPNEFTVLLRQSKSTGEKR